MCDGCSARARPPGVRSSPSAARAKSDSRGSLQRAGGVRQKERGWGDEEGAVRGQAAASTPVLRRLVLGAGRRGERDRLPLRDRGGKPVCV